MTGTVVAYLFIYIHDFNTILFSKLDHQFHLDHFLVDDITVDDRRHLILATTDQLLYLATANLDRRSMK